MRCVVVCDSWRLGFVWEVSWSFLCKTHKVRVRTTSSVDVRASCKFYTLTNVSYLLAVFNYHLIVVHSVTALLLGATSNDWLIGWLIDSIHPFLPSFICSFIHIRSFVHIHLFFLSFIHSFFLHSFVLSLTDWFIHWFLYLLCFLFQCSSWTCVTK